MSGYDISQRSYRCVDSLIPFKCSLGGNWEILPWEVVVIVANYLELSGMRVLISASRAFCDSLGKVIRNKYLFIMIFYF
jgi:hypothetical protein